MREHCTIVLLCLFITACKQPDSKLAISAPLSHDLNSPLSYANGFTIEEKKDYHFLTVFNPWNKDTLATYLVLKDIISEKDLPEADFIVDLPVKKIACQSSTGIGLLSQLNSGKMISAATDPELIYDSLLYREYLKGNIIHLGKSINLNTEVVIEHNPDLLIKHIFGGKELIDTRIRDAGIPIVYHLEFMETHPLGRAEWIKFFAVFVNKSTLADSLFAMIEKTYQHYSSLAKKETIKPTVLDGSSYKGVWYAAGGHSFPSKLYADAGTDYFWKDNSQSGSISLSFESILENQIDADYWIGPSTGSKEELLKIESRYALLKSFRENNVFFYGKRTNPNGGLDYFESGIIRPDILLTDLLWVFHPHLLETDYNPVFIQRIE